MKKNYKKIFILISLMLLANNCAKASLLWDINDGISEFRKNKFETSKNFFEVYVQNSPNDKDGYYWLAKTYHELKEEKEKTQENFKKAYELTLEDENIEKIDFNIKNLSTAEDYFDMASMYFENGNLKEAVTYADMILKINPKSSSAYFIKAKIAQLENNKKKASEFLNKAILLNNKLLKTDLAKSLKITQLPEISKELYAIYALENYFSPDINTAIKHFKKYLINNPQDLNMANLLVDLYIKNNDLTSAQNQLDEILKTDENNIQATLTQAKIFQLKNDNVAFVETLLKAQKINPNNQDVLLELGNYYLKQNDFIEANKHFETLININDKLYEGYFGYIYSLASLGKTEKAIEFIRKISELNPNTSEIPFLLSKICIAKGEYKEGLSFINEAIQKTSHFEYFKTRAEINLVLKNYENAIQDYETILNFKNANINFDELRENITKCYLKLNDANNAKRYINFTTLLDKTSVIYKYNLYKLYQLENNEEKALKLKKQIKKFKPSTTKDYIDLSQITYEELGYNPAIQILKKGLKKQNSYLLYLQMIKLSFFEGLENKVKIISNELQNL